MDTATSRAADPASQTSPKSTVHVKLSALSVFINEILRRLEKGSLVQGDLLSIDLTPKANLLDLFTLGRLLAFIHELQVSAEVKSRFMFPVRKRLRNLEELGFFDYCDANEIGCDFSQGELFTAGDEKLQILEPRTRGKSYWDCLIKLKRHKFDRPQNEQESATTVNRFLRIIADQLLTSINRHGIDSKSVSSELSHLLNGMLRELVSNIVTHSQASNFLFAMTLSRETNIEFRTHRPGVFAGSGQDKYEFVIMDMGQGIFPSVMDILTYGGSKRLDNEYFRLSKWDDSRYLYKNKEESLLTNIFRGDLVIRKGRKSEGLYELGQALAWFGGDLHLFTGRSQMQISSTESEELGIKARGIRNPYYLPGVIASAILPSQQTKTATIRQMAADADRFLKACELRRLKRLPSGLFGGLSAGKIRRRSELDAEAIVTSYNKAVREKMPKEYFWDLNLKMSDNIDVNFIDSLIQELCKRIDEVDPPESRNFFKLIFTNVPRNIINALRKRNCASFLMLKETFCLMLDEADEPHFLGVPKVSRNVFDVDDALKLIFYSGSITGSKLTTQLGLTPVAMEYLQKLLKRDAGSVFSCSGEGEQLSFESCDIIGALAKLRKRRFGDLEKALMYEGENTAFMLRNNAYVDSIVDFCLLWSDNDCLVDCAKLLLLESGFPLVDSIVAFMNNGDRLAAAIQRFTGIPNLIIVDPHNYASWNKVDIDGEFVLVVDALYEGDDVDGYIQNFMRVLKENPPPRRPRKIIAFCDFRVKAEVAENGRRDHGLEDLEIVTVPIPNGVTTPEAIDPVTVTSKVTVLRNLQNYIYSKPKRPKKRLVPEAVGQDQVETLDPNSSGGDTEGWKVSHYNPIELSTEFWQNVSALRVVDTERTGREVRNVLYYENNERLVQNPRTRRAVVEFVSDFVKNVLGLQVDAILHPAHPVGSFLAQMVSAQLSSPPLVFPLTQRSYGGQIEITPGDYEYYHDMIKSFTEQRGRDQLNCLIVDDSILSGNSVFTMLGVAAKLGLQANGVLVLLSRLTSEVSKAMASLPLSFAALYRLHMPILTDDQSPDTKLKQINDNVLRNSNSYFAQLRASQLSNEESHFRLGEIDLDSMHPPIVGEGKLSDIEGTYIDTYMLRQIVHNLILHPDPNILSFKTRVAIAYNFLGQLVHEQGFWSLLRELFVASDPPSAQSQSIRFVQKVIYILAFSKFVHPYSIYDDYQELCRVLVKASLEGGKWVELKDLISDCLMSLGTIGSESLMDVGPDIIKTLLPTALQDTSTIAVSADGQQTPGLAQQAARQIIGSLSWSVHVLVSQKGHTVFENESIDRWVEAVPSDQLSHEGYLMLIDILEPVISVSPSLREKLEIGNWRDEDSFLEKLALGQSSNDMMNYLMEAPGYTCTLKTLLRICKASTLLLYAKNASDKEFFVRVFETSEPIRAKKELKAEHLREGHLPKLIRDRMNDSLFFSSIDVAHASRLDVFLSGARHKWAMGGAVNTAKDEKIKYYIILGYKNLPPTRNLQNTTYYYWLRCESMLREILPSIYSRYVESSTAWNALIQSLSPIHPLRLSSESEEPFNSRRLILRHAMASADTGDLLRRSVMMASEPVYNLQDVRSRINITASKLRNWVESALRDHPAIAEQYLQRETEAWPVMISSEPFSRVEEITFCALPMALLEFIAFESLCNALSYYSERIKVTIDFVEEENKVMNFANGHNRKLFVKMTITNDIHPNRKPGTDISTGTHACEAAVAAVDGKYRSYQDGNKWISITQLPAYIVPEDLTNRLYDYLT